MRWIIPFLIAVAGGLAFYVEHRRAENERSGLEIRLQLAMTKSDQTIHDLQNKLEAEGVARAAAEKNERDMKNASKQSPPSQANRVFRGADLRKDPAYAGLWRKQQLRNIQRQYGDTIAALNLPADQAAKLRDMLVARDDAVMDAREAGTQAGLTGRELGLAVSQAADAVNDEIKSLIGNDNYAALQASQQVGVAKSMIENSVALDMTAAGVPLTPAQLTSVAQAYANSIHQGRGQAALVPDPQTGLTPVFQNALDNVAPILGPGQVPIFRDYLLEQVQQQQYFRTHNPAPSPSG